MENYKEKYENLIEKLKKAKEEHGGYTFSSVVDKIVPELRESEDERIRKGLIKGLSAMRDIHKRQTFSDDAINIDDAIAWLEKQGEKTIPKNIDDAALQYVDTCAIDGEVTHDNITEPYWNNHSMMNAYKAGWLEKQGEKTNPYIGISFEYNGHIWGMCAREGGVDILCDSQLINHIEYLQREPGCEVNFTTKSEDLEEELKRYIDSKGGGTITINVKDIAHHFAEWQREKDIKLEKIDDLEEFAQKWAYSNYHKELDEVNCDCLYSGVKKGAEWQKQKDLEDSLKSDMTMPNKFYDKGKADAINEMKEALQTEYEKGRFDMREEIMKEAVDGEEIWKPIVGFEEYEVSNKGRVLSRKQKLDGVLLKQQTNLVGYKYVTLRDKKYNPHLALVHRLVAEAFIPNPFKKPTVNHIDEDKGNNIVSNLEWATYIEQKNHGSQKRPDVCPSMIDNEGRQPRRLISTRAYLRKCKYIIDDLNMIAYYDDSTHRSKKFEEEKRFYNYKPYNGEKFDRLPFITRPQKAIEVVSDEGVITVYKNISQAAKSLGVSVSLIKRRLDGIGGTSGNFAKLINYTFKYKEDNNDTRIY